MVAIWDLDFLREHSDTPFTVHSSLITHFLTVNCKKLFSKNIYNFIRSYSKNAYLCRQKTSY